MMRRGHRPFVRNTASTKPSFYNYANTLLSISSTVIDIWDMELGVTTASGGVDSWVGQKANTTLAAVTPGTGPVYSAANTAFAGRPTCTGASGKGFRVTGLSAFAANASKPYVWCVMRMPALITGGAAADLFALGQDGASDDFLVDSQGTATTSDITFMQNENAATDTQTIVVPTTCQLLEAWVGGTTAHLALGGVDVATTLLLGEALGGDTDAIGVFTSAKSAAHYGAFSIAAMGVSVAVPAAAERAALLNTCQMYYGAA